MKKLQVIAHRGAFLPQGPLPTITHFEIAENTIEAFTRAIENSWGIETDVRQTKDGRFIISHEPTEKQDIPLIDDLCKLKPPFVAFQLKTSNSFGQDLAVGRAITQAIKQYGLKESILFDPTLEVAKVLRAEFPWLNLSVSVGEKNYSGTIYTPNQVFTREFTGVFNCVWVDEWKINGSIYTQKLFEQFKYSFMRIDVISPELHYNENHPLSRDLERLKNLWQDIKSWELADGICTDYPIVVRQLNTFT